MNRAPSFDANDPRQTRVLAGRVLHPRASYVKDRRIVLCHATDKSRLSLACATDHSLQTSCPHSYKTAHVEDFGQVAFTMTLARIATFISPSS